MAKERCSENNLRCPRFCDRRADWIAGSRIQYLDDFLSNLYPCGSLRRGKGTVAIVICLIALLAEVIQILPSTHHIYLPAIGQAEDQIGMRSVGTGDGKAEFLEKTSGENKRG